MRIQPVSLINNSGVYVRKVDNKHKNVFAPVTDTVSFSGALTLTGKDFRKFGKYMRCLYTDEPMLMTSTLKKMKGRGMFQGPISEVVKKLKPYKEEYLIGVEKSVFERIEELATREPELNLTDAMNKLADEFIPNLRKEQKPILDEIKTEGAKLPGEYLEPFFRFMETADRKIFDEPVKQKFSLKEFLYQAEKSVQQQSDANLRNRLSNSLKLLSDEGFTNNSKPLDPKTVKKVFNFVNLKVTGKKGAYYDKHLKPLETDKNSVIKKLVEDMRDVAKQSGFRGFERLCDNHLMRLEGKPVHVKFSNKAFVYDLQKIIGGVPDSELKNRMFTLANSLPNSARSVDAFILKCRDTEPDRIGERLFDSSILSVEHLLPRSEGGSDLMANCALVRKGENSKRGSEPLWITLSKYPAKNPQKYLNHLTRLVNKKKIPYDDALAQIQTIEREGRITLNKAALVKPELSFIDVIKTELKLLRKNKSK